MVASTVYLVALSVAWLVLISLGLAVIFGMMGVINLAQGEFIMLGAYACAAVTSNGWPLWSGMLAAFIGVGLFGVLVERIVVRYLYGRLIDTLLATWGLSLFLVGLVTTVLGPGSRSVAADYGNLQLGGQTVGVYNLVLMGAAIAMVAATWAMWRWTSFGLIVRGTMQDPVVASCLGVDRGRVYALTFAYGAALGGLAGAVLVPVTGASPTMGAFFVTKSFIAVIAGGHLPILGTLSASGLFGAIDGLLSYRWSSVVGEIGVLLIAIALLRLLPQGITGRMQRGF